MSKLEKRMIINDHIINVWLSIAETSEKLAKNYRLSGNIEKSREWYGKSAIFYEKVVRFTEENFLSKIGGD